MVLKKLLPVFVIAALILFASNFFLQYAIGQSVYPLPPPSSKVTIERFPEKVRESLKNVIGITVTYKNNSPRSLLGNELVASGTGFMIEPGIYVTARHVLMDTITRSGFALSFDKYSVPSSNILNYVITGTTDTNNKTQDISLRVIGMGMPSEYQDFLILQSTNYPSELKPIRPDETILAVDDTVYNAGYVHIFVPLASYPINSLVLLDILRLSFEGKINSVITNMPINKRGASVLYRIETRMESGFSGGPILNSEGRAVAISSLRNDNFLYAIPIRDLRPLVNQLKRDGVIK